MNTPTRTRNASLDALRVLGVVGVVAIHASNAHLRDPLAYYFDELGRFAVPMFFVLSAYFWKPEELADPTRLVARVASRVLPAFLIFTVLWIAYGFMRDPHYHLDFSPLGIFLLGWSGGADYLWFLPALVVGTALVNYCAKVVGWRTTAILAVLAYLLGCLIGSYGQLMLGGSRPLWWFRNGVLFAPVCLVTGVYLRRHRDLVARLPVQALLVAAIAFAALQLVEGRLILGRTTMGHDFGLMTAPYAFALVLLFMRLSMRGQAWEILGRASFGAYLIHPFLLVYLVPLLRGMPLALFILVVSALSLALSAAYTALRTRLIPAGRAA